MTLCVNGQQKIGKYCDMKQLWTICDPERNPAAAEAFSSLDTVCRLEGEDIAASPISRVVRIRVAGRRYYIKQYSRAGKHLRRFFGRSRVRAEWENLQLFARLGIPTPRLVAYGQEVKCGLFRRGALITEELEQTVDLAALARERSPLLADRRWMDQVLMRTADYVRRLHDLRFIHTDLKWRNILVTREEIPQIYFIDCPGGRIRNIDRSQRWYIKDIACLDKVAKYQLSRTMRLRFYLRYAGRRRLHSSDRCFIQGVLAYFEGRE
jgi:tRNA A-37 threonylcarbamoyl transferase component Bud32